MPSGCRFSHSRHELKPNDFRYNHTVNCFMIMVIFNLVMIGFSGTEM